MWQHWNNILHNAGQTIHIQETIALDEEIRHKMQLGLDDLDEHYTHLFQTPLQDLMCKSMTHKRMWIMSVWVARDNKDDEVQITQNRHRDIVPINK
jgi:hypothetical protein